jgi:hypothetical protein
MPYQSTAAGARVTRVGPSVVVRVEPSVPGETLTDASRGVRRCPITGYRPQPNQYSSEDSLSQRERARVRANEMDQAPQND